MKRITITLSDEAEKAFNEIMYSLPKNEDGTGVCTQDQAVNYAFCCVSRFEKEMEQDIPCFLNERILASTDICPICNGEGGWNDGNGREDCYRCQASGQI